jgi:ribosome-binding factor A
MSRSIRVGDFIRDEISKIVKQELRDPRITKHLTISDVVVSRDLAYANIYVSSFEHDTNEDQEGVIKVLNNASGFFRTKLSKRHNMRTTPKLKFHYDSLIADGLRIEGKIFEARSKDRLNIAKKNG